MINNKQNPFNVIFCKKEFLFPYEFPLAEFPFYIDVELTNDCNLDCIMCRRQIMKRAVNFMDLKYIKKIVDEVKNYECGIRFVRQGEPILHPECCEAIAYAVKNGVLTYISTNGFAGKNKIRDLFFAKPDVIRFSFQGTTPEEFEKFRVPAKYKVVAGNIHFISRLRKENKDDSPYLIISSSLTNETEKDKELFRNYWLQYVNNVEFSKTVFSWLDKVKKVKDVKEHENLERKHKPCMEVVTKLSVNWNGDIGACCSDQEGVHVIGNLDNMTLKEAWNSQKEDDLRNMVGGNLFHGQISHCKDCYLEDHKFDELKEKSMI